MSKVLQSLGINIPEGGSMETQASVRATDGMEVVLLVDSHNRINELSHKTMLCTVRHLWPGGVRFAFDCYCHAVTLIIRRTGGKAETLLSKEGVI